LNMMNVMLNLKLIIYITKTGFLDIFHQQDYH
jgi:hypothetical protein